MDSLAGEIEQLYRTQYVAFRNGMAGVTGSYESARDVVQEAFARALRVAVAKDRRLAKMLPSTKGLL